MKRLIELLEAYEGISKKLNEVGYIGNIGGAPYRRQFSMEELIRWIREESLEFEIKRIKSALVPYLIEATVGDHVLYAVFDQTVYDEYFDEEGNLK